MLAGSGPAAPSRCCRSVMAGCAGREGEVCG